MGVETNAAGSVGLSRRLGSLLSMSVAAASLVAAPSATASAAQGAVSIDHKQVACIVANQYPKFDACFTARSAMARARVMFRAEGTPAWYYVDMKPEGLCYSGVLPRPSKSTKKIDYYIEASDQSLAEGRTAEYAPRVGTRSECSKTMSAAGFLSTASTIVGALGGAPVVIPPGFSAVGVVLAGGAAGAAGGASAGGAAVGGGAAGGGMSGTTIGLVAGGVAVAGVAAAAAGGAGDSGPPATTPPTCSPGQFTISRAVFQPATFDCPPAATLFVYNLDFLVDVVNTSQATVTLSTVTSAITCSGKNPDNVTCPDVNDGPRPFTPSSVSPGASATIRVTRGANCSNRTVNGVPPNVFAEWSGSVTLQTSCGSVTAQTQNRHRLNAP